MELSTAHLLQALSFSSCLLFHPNLLIIIRTCARHALSQPKLLISIRTWAKAALSRTYNLFPRHAVTRAITRDPRSHPIRSRKEDPGDADGVAASRNHWWTV